MNPKDLFISNIEVILDQIKPIYCVGYVVEPSDVVNYKTYQLNHIIAFIYNHYRIEGTAVVKSQTIAGDILDKQHIVDFIEHNYRSIIRRMLIKELNRKEQDNVN
jgi:hypothetical protein